MICFEFKVVEYNKICMDAYNREIDDATIFHGSNTHTKLDFIIMFNVAFNPSNPSF